MDKHIYFINIICRDEKRGIIGKKSKIVRGNRIVECKNPIKTTQDILAIQEYIRNKNGYKEVLIENIVKL